MKSPAQEPLSTLLAGRKRRRILRIGYAGIIALLIFASFEAYEAQESASTQHLDVYRHYVQQDEAMAALRYAVWLAGNRVRDFFIETSPQTAEALRGQLKNLRADSDRALKRLDELRSLQNPEVRAAIQDFWDTLEPVPDTMLHATDAQQYAFAQEEIAPRRSTLYTALRELLRAEQANLQLLEAELAAMRRDSARRLIVILGVCVALALVVARFSVAHSDNLERATESQFEALAETKRELEALSARLVDIEEEGRKRLARELHDEIGQALAVLQIEISHAQVLPDERLPDIRARLVRARELAERTVQTIRGLTQSLRPTLLDDLGLVPALQSLLEDFMRRSGVSCEFSAANVDEQLPDPVKTCVYRVVQEAIHNAEKHAAASRIRVGIFQSDGSLVAEVEDNGRGFDARDNGAARGQQGLGLVGMRERAIRLGGTLALESARGHGTRLILTVPAPSISGPREIAPRVSTVSV